MAATLVSAALTRAPTTRLAAARHPRTARATAPRRAARAVPGTVAPRARATRFPRSRPTRLLGRDRYVRVGRALGAGTARYRVTFYTGEKMGLGLSAPDAGVQIMLIGEDGRALCTGWTATPTSPPATTRANPSAARARRRPSRLLVPAVRARRRGRVRVRRARHRVPVAIWVAPEQGGDWFLEEVEVRLETEDARRALEFPDAPPALVSSSASTSFPCGENVRDAVELRPSAFVKLTPEQRVEMRAEGLREYGALKVRMLAVTGAAVLLGCGADRRHEPRERPRGDARVRQRRRRRARLPRCSRVTSTRSATAWLRRPREAEGREGRPAAEGEDSSPRDRHPGAALASVLLNVLVWGASSSPVRIALLAWCGVAGARWLGLDDGIDAFGNPAAPTTGDALAAILGFFSYSRRARRAGFSGTDVMSPARPPSSPRTCVSRSRAAWTDAEGARGGDDFETFASFETVRFRDVPIVNVSRGWKNEEKTVATARPTTSREGRMMLSRTRCTNSLYRRLTHEPNPARVSTGRARGRLFL